MEVKFVKTVPEILSLMRNCYQFKDMNMYEHGLAVSREYVNIITSLEEGLSSETLPEQLVELYNKHLVLDFGIMLNYHILHDLGKPLVKVVDEDGKQHFPNHSEISYQQFKILYPYNEEESFMIKHDMDFHSLKVEDLKELAKSKYGFSLYLTAWAEILANANMFGGYDSISFKIKRKKLIKCLKLF